MKIIENHDKIIQKLTLYFIYTFLDMNHCQIDVELLKQSLKP